MIIALNKKQLLAIALTVVIVLSSVFIGKEIVVSVNGKLRSLPIYSVDREDKKIAFTFDCAWGTTYTDELLSIFEKEEVKVTFFMVEFWATKYPDYVKKISDLGHEIGTHSSTHSYMSKMSEENIRKEMLSSSMAIENITNKKVELFRAPYGDYNNRLIDTVSSMGFYTIQWDVDSLDWKDLSKDEIFKRVSSRVKSGSIVLFHNNGLHTASAVEILISTLKKEGYSFETIGNLIYKEDFYINSNGVQIKG